MGVAAIATAAGGGAASAFLLQSVSSLRLLLLKLKLSPFPPETALPEKGIQNRTTTQAAFLLVPSFVMPPEFKAVFATHQSVSLDFSGQSLIEMMVQRHYHQANP